ncbi:hypothetical protein FSW04_09550 [Baekduia soli]|uniref:DoxX family membrane protein n=1 Tax=Baekduia soli TaxID=496014 RepID=A0A5B8U3Y6_9ACTN|nr:hypothetical protein [Baekduia soli]QEC47789.1 hypothetical protein FSW04_09550 [Baekduia soli]
MRVLTRSAGPAFVVAGLLHFLKPRLYEAIMPDGLPAHRALVYASGVAEIAGGAGLMAADPRVRRWAGRWLVATLAGVFPANVHMARHAERYPDIPGGRTTLLARLPLQGAFAAWVLAAGHRSG